ncbi:hypothetical protein AHiyo8_53960 [Arthrobacter sp. Hiyo8]|nr:hypothetical protein AHiyo8_53960 [Arthrobacter sp. Hiyo8]
MVLGEFGFAVDAHGGPDDLGACEERAAADVADGLLQGLRLGAVEPHHDVGVRAHGGDVVASAEDHAVLGELGSQLLEILHSVGAAQDIARPLEHGPQRKELLFGFGSFSDRFGRSVAHGTSLPRRCR